MNRIYGEGKDGKVMVCVIDSGNVNRLTHEQMPIEIDLNDADGPWKQGLPAKLKVLIWYSETPIADTKTFRERLHLKPEQLKDHRTPLIETKRPHCGNCKSVVEQVGIWRSDSAPVWLVFCPTCGEIFSTTPPIESLMKGMKDDEPASGEGPRTPRQ